MLTLRNSPIFEGPSETWMATVADLDLRPGQKRVLLAHPEGFSNEDYRALTSIDRDQAYREITEMVEAGILRTTGQGRGARYRISPELREGSRWLDSRLPKLRVALVNLGHITNSEYRALFNVTRYAAARELRRLVDGGYLQLVGERRGARYLPGQKLRREDL